MAKFLSQNTIYRLLQRELPEGVYPDGAPNQFYSTASIDAKAKVIAGAYSNLERIDANNFPQTADERIDDWLIKMFGVTSGGLTLAQKRARTIEKIRKQPKINLWEVLTLVTGFVPVGTYVQIVEWCGRKGGSWQLDVSTLGVQTILGFGVGYMDFVSDPTTWCSFVSNLNWRLGFSELNTNTELAADDLYKNVTYVQLDAYNYEVRIFGYTLSAEDLATVEREISKAEPARSTHIIRQNLNLVDFALNTTVTNIDEFDLVDCITRDIASSTGYSGRV